jgi:hypothetical protein
MKHNFLLYTAPKSKSRLFLVAKYCRYMYKYFSCEKQSVYLFGVTDEAAQISVYIPKQEAVSGCY